MNTLETYLGAVPETFILNGVGDDERFVMINDEPLWPALSLKIRNHSPDGFNWGYAGSGPAQLALAILLNYLPVDLAEKHYQAFKFCFVAMLPQQTNFNVRVPFREILTSLDRGTGWAGRFENVDLGKAFEKFK